MLLKWRWRGVRREGSALREALAAGSSTGFYTDYRVYEYQYTHTGAAYGRFAAARHVYAAFYRNAGADFYPAAHIHCDFLYHTDSTDGLQHADSDSHAPDFGPGLYRAGCGEYARRAGRDLSGYCGRGE